MRWLRPLRDFMLRRRSPGHRIRYRHAQTDHHRQMRRLPSLRQRLPSARMHDARSHQMETGPHRTRRQTSALLSRINFINNRDVSRHVSARYWPAANTLAMPTYRAINVTIRSAYLFGAIYSDCAVFSSFRRSLGATLPLAVCAPIHLWFQTILKILYIIEQIIAETGFQLFVGIDSFLGLFHIIIPRFG